MPRGSRSFGRRAWTMLLPTRRSLTQVCSVSSIQGPDAALTTVYVPQARSTLRCSASSTDCWVLFAVRRLVNENRLPHLLLYGPPGTGKTSTILAVARQMYGSSLATMTLELNASDDRGIDVVRQQVVDFASTRTIFRCALSCELFAPYSGGKWVLLLALTVNWYDCSNKFKLIILDECDAMTKDAQFALRRGRRPHKAVCPLLVVLLPGLTLQAVSCQIPASRPLARCCCSECWHLQSSVLQSSRVQRGRYFLIACGCLGQMTLSV